MAKSRWEIENQDFSDAKGCHGLENDSTEYSTSTVANTGSTVAPRFLVQKSPVSSR
jgi:hypothetical protein